MLTQRDVSLKELNLLKRKNEFAGVSGKLIVSIDKPIVVKRMDGFDLRQGRINLSKKRSNGKNKVVCHKKSLLIKWRRKMVNYQNL
jgi:hypothetical protein